MQTGSEYDFLADIVANEYGVDLRAAGPEVLQAKIAKYCERHGLRSLDECASYLRADRERARDLGDIIYSQRTCLNRTPEDFRFLVERVRARGPAPDGAPLRVWCAACATGQEAYTIAIYLLEHVFGAVDDGDAPFRVFATDCSRGSLEKARRGRYHVTDVEQLDPLPRDKYFVPADGDWFLVAPRVRATLEFGEVNLVTSDFPFERSLDWVFLRNALDFHSDPSRAAILSKVRATLKDGGCLVLGDCPRLEPEHVFRHGFALEAPGCYRAVPA